MGLVEEFNKVSSKTKSIVRKLRETIVLPDKVRLAIEIAVIILGLWWFSHGLEETGLAVDKYYIPGLLLVDIGLFFVIRQYH